MKKELELRHIRDKQELVLADVTGDRAKYMELRAIVFEQEQHQITFDKLDQAVEIIDHLVKEVWSKEIDQNNEDGYTGDRFCIFCCGTFGGDGATGHEADCKVNKAQVFIKEVKGSE